MSLQRGGLGLMGVFLVLAVLATLSARLGGPVSWQVTNGVSMLPGITPGTLVVVHRKAAYEVGDIVSYRSELLDKIVLHRVVELEGDRMVLKGDNNTWLDPERPLPSAALGARVFQVGGVGPALEALRRPVALVVGAVLSALLLLGSRRHRSRHRRRAGGEPEDTGRLASGRAPGGSARRTSPPVPALPRTVQSFAGWALVAAVALGLLATTGPLVGSEEGRPAQQSLSWTYGGEAAQGLVYPEGQVGTGDVMYPRLVGAATVSADLDFRLPEDATVSGTWRLDVSVENGDGWTKTTTTGRETPLEAGAQRLVTTVPLRELLTLAHDVERESGVTTGKLTIAVEAVLDLEVDHAGRSSSAQTSTGLHFDADDAKVVLNPNTPLEHEAPLPVEPSSGPRHVGLGGASVPAGLLQTLAVVVGTLSLLVLALVRLRPEDPDEDSRIARTAGHLIVNADPAEDPEQIVDVDSFEALALIAERYERVLLCGDSAGIPFYYVIDDGIAYRYYTAGAAAKLDAADQVRAHQRAQLDAHGDRPDASELDVAAPHLVPQQRTDAVHRETVDQ